MVKKIIKILCITLVALITIVIGYLTYLVCQYNRIDDNVSYKQYVLNNQEQVLKINNKYTALSYNIGFGAYSQDYSFFLDSDILKDGTKIVGKHSKAFSKEDVLKNTNGVINILKTANTDFVLLQEIDVKSTRSYKVNQFELIKEQLLEHASVFVPNYHSAYIAYPFNDPHGKSISGLATYSRYNIEDVTRKQFEITKNLISKFFDLDRCFTATYIPTDNFNYLVLINLHMSAYDEGGVYRAKQWQQLTEFMQYEYDRGNYVVCGGDFNHDIANSKDLFISNTKTSEKVYQLTNNDLSENFKFATSTNAPTYRSASMPYEKGVSYSAVIDGFIVSDNVEVTYVENIDLEFLYSDHNPVIIDFILK